MEGKNFNLREHIPEIITITGGSVWIYRDYKQGKISKEKIGGILTKVVNMFSSLIDGESCN